MLRFCSSGLSASAVQFSKSLQFFTGHESHQDACHAGISSCIGCIHKPQNVYTFRSREDNNFSKV